MRALGLLLMTLTAASCGSRGSGPRPTEPRVIYVPQPRQMCVTVAPPAESPLTCTDPAAGSCDPKIDAARLIDDGQRLRRWAIFVEAACQLHDAPRWGEKGASTETDPDSGADLMAIERDIQSVISTTQDLVCTLRGESLTCSSP